MRRWMPAAVLLLLLAVGLVAAACGGDEEKVTSQASATKSAEASSSSLSLEADDFYFQPKEIAAQAGKPVTVKVKNEGKATHTFTIDSLKVDQTLSAGTDKDITFTPTQSGDLKFYCRFHQKSNAMEGTLKVSGAGAATSPKPGATSGGGGYSGY